MNPLCRLLGHRWSKPYLSFGIGFETATAEVYCRRIGCSAKSWVTKIPPWREGEGRPLVERRTEGERSLEALAEELDAAFEGSSVEPRSLMKHLGDNYRTEDEDG